MNTPFPSLFELQLLYDRGKKGWWCEITSAGDFDEKLVFYEIVGDEDREWREMFTVRDDDRYASGGIRCRGMWTRDQQLHYVFVSVHALDQNDSHFYWATRDQASLLTSETCQLLGHVDGIFPHVFAQRCLVMVLQRHLEQPLSEDGLRTGPGTWEWSYLILAQDQPPFHHETLSQLTRPIVHTHYPEEDFWEAFDRSIAITDGPPSGAGVQATCVVALAQYTREKREQTPSMERKHDDHAVPQHQAAVFWIDQQGQLLQSADGFLGTEMSLCCCENKVIGVYLYEGRWRFWSWVLGEKAILSSAQTFPEDVKKVILVAGKSVDEGSEAHFWCIEEYADRVRVTQRSCEQFEEIAVAEIENFTLLQDFSSSRQGKALNVDGLVLLGVDGNNSLKLFYFQ